MAPLATPQAKQVPRRDPWREVFIAHSGSDQGIVEKLRANLQCWQLTPVSYKLDSQDAGSVADFTSLLIQAPRIVVVLSSEFLRSINCMRELWGIYQDCREDRHALLKRVVFLVPLELKTGSASDRLIYRSFWSEEFRKIDCLRLNSDFEIDAAYFEEHSLKKALRDRVSEILAIVEDQALDREGTSNGDYSLICRILHQRAERAPSFRLAPWLRSLIWHFSTRSWS
jgi:hypothetical protein